jgi:hypothetical protein
MCTGLLLLLLLLLHGLGYSLDSDLTLADYL